ncbi:hypothetical protein L1887_03925 [Cichorium endivia]|nr:hypothetical protein L1887_03925 [Cichorium endivia]
MSSPRRSMSEPGKDVNQQYYYHHHHPPPPHEYGTFQEVHYYPPPPPVIGYPQPVPSPVASCGPSVKPHVHGYQAVPVSAVAEGIPVSERRLPFCGIGIGWFLFIVGFFLAAIPWYVGAFMLCSRSNKRKQSGCLACLIAAIFGTVAYLSSI